MANFEKVYPSKEAALAAFGPQNFSAIAHTPLHLPAQKTPTLLEMERLYGPKTLAVIVRNLIYHLQHVLRQPNKLGEEETDDLAARMCEAYSGIEAGELVSFFWHLECGDYPTGFDRVDPVKIMESLGKFYRALIRDRVTLDARRQALETIRKADENERNSITHEQYERTFLKDPSIKGRVDLLIKKMGDRDPQEFADSWKKEFSDVSLHRETKKSQQ